MKRASRDSTIGARRDGTEARLVLDVPSRPEHVASARHAVVSFLMEHGVSSVVVDDMELVASELVTNAIVHPKPASDRSDPVHVEVEASDAVVLVVSNIGPAMAIPPVERWLQAPPLATSGRGLGIVRRLCDAVAVEQDGDRAVVRCRRRLPDGGGSP